MRPDALTIATLRRFDDAVIAELSEIGTVIEPAGAVSTTAEAAALIREADALFLTALDKIDAPLLAEAVRLKWISSVGVGLDHVDLDACARAGIQVANTPGAVTEPTADLAFTLLLAGARRIVEADSFVRRTLWTRASPPFWGLDIYGRRLGIIGLGRIGRALARRGAAFGMDLVYHDQQPYAGAPDDRFSAALVPLDELLATSDFVSIHAPLTDATYHMIGAREIGLMKDSAVLVNSGRGGLIDENALVDALQAGKIAHAALDVMEGEPDVNPRLLTCDRVTLTPHIGTATVATRRAMAGEALANLRRLIGAG